MEARSMLDELRVKYDTRRGVYSALMEESLFILRAALDLGNVKTHAVVGRIKSLESIHEKALRKDLENPLDYLSDIVGLRVVCLLLSDVERVGSLIRSNFCVVE